MAKKKKSRKVGLIGVRKDPDFEHKTSSGRVKKRKGNSPGSRHNVEDKRQQKSTSGGNQDPRLGSKKPVPLIKTPVATQKRKFATPAEELAALEADSRLISLLDKLDQGKPLNKDQQHYVDEHMARHKALCELMGITADADESDDDEDEFAALDAIKLDDFER
ncbi:Der GTPase-activating protein YihI [Alteromonas gilva]|uniref:Der GTPase-activating protein YihI n=1 Tax=Alteromonas gilva TaxID=2987522 RepID=A0ABT5KY94_9ALTE|nr:Der GTPase-activating protein YihI [Alteromonas gilva]MDC8829149.1 Der GTPase-activating protein YihI [Alteromonas gilva]